MDARLVCILLVLALLAPSVQAAPASGQFVASGRLGLPAGARQEARVHGAYLDGAENGFDALRIEAPTLHVQRYEVQYREARLPLLRPNLIDTWNVYNYTLHDAVVTLTEGDHRGWVGMYFPSTGGPLLAVAGGPSSVEGQAGITLGEGLSGHNEADEGPIPWTQGYDWSSPKPLLLVESRGDVNQSGAGQLKLQGPDLRFASRENDSSYATGSTPDGDAPVGTRFSRWFFLSYEDATVSISNAGTSRLAASELQATWSGTASFKPVEGSLRTTDASYAATGAPVRVAGDLAARVAPAPAGQEVRLRLDLAGDLLDTTLLGERGSASTPLGARPSGWAFLLGAFFLAGALALVAGVLWRRKGAGPPPIAPEDRLALARIEAGRDRFQDAVAHVREARAQAPGSVRLILEEASYLGAMGRVEEALAHYAEAALLDPEGDAEFQAAVLLLQSGGDPARAEALFVGALTHTPLLVLETLYDASGTFDALRGRPAFEAAVERARRQLEA